jgi:phosphoribosyl-dephospho-CoA transferase
MKRKRPSKPEQCMINRTKISGENFNRERKVAGSIKTAQIRKSALDAAAKAIQNLTMMRGWNKKRFMEINRSMVTRIREVLPADKSYARNVAVNMTTLKSGSNVLFEIGI